MQYPKALNTTRIKKYPSICIVQDQISGESTPVLPVQAAILSLCQGVLTKDEISKGISDVYKYCLEDASWLVDNTLARCKNHLKLGEEIEKIQTPFSLNPLDYTYKTEYTKNSDSALPEPYEAVLLITERCNLRCKYCYRGGGHKTRDISTKDWIKISNDLGSLKVIRCMVSGGEPTLHKGIVQILHSLLENDIFPYLATNGTKLTPKMVSDFKDIRLKYVQVSLDTVDKDLFFYITGVNCLESVLKGIDRLTNAGIVVRVKAVITKLNAPNIVKLIDFCDSVGVAEVAFDLYSPSAMGGKKDALFLTQEQYEMFKETIKKQQEKYKGKMSIGSFSKIPRWKNADSIIHCGAFLGSLTINSQGEVIVCDQFDDSRLRPGNVLKNSIMSVWNSDKMKRVRELKNVETEIHPICKNCEYFNVCKTGCFSMSKLYTGNPFAPDPRCWKTKNRGPIEVFE